MGYGPTTLPLHYDILVEYKRGLKKKLANALSRKYFGGRGRDQKDEALLSVILPPTLEWIDEIKLGYSKDLKVQDLLVRFEKGDLPPTNAVRNGLIFYKQRLLVVNDSNFKQKQLNLLIVVPRGGRLRVCD